MAAKRIYMLTNHVPEQGTAVRLIEATSQAEAIRRVVADSIKCAVATPEELIACTKREIEVERMPAAKAPT